MKSKNYPYSKSVMLNAVYDAMENLGMSIERANSEHGMILTSFDGCQCRIMVETVYPAKTAKLTLLPINEDCRADAEWRDVFFDEVSAMLQQSKITP